MSSKQTFQWMMKEYKFVKRPLVILVLMSVVTSVTAIAFAYLSKEVIDAVVDDTGLFRTFGLYLVVLVIVQVILKYVYH